MLRKLFISLVLISLFASLSGTPLPSALADNSPALVAVNAPSPAAIQRFNSTGLPAYAMLDDILLAGADAAGQQALTKAGLSFRLLDTRLSTGYYLASRMPSASGLEWRQYGRLLLDLGDQALLQTNRSQAERLSKAGAELQYISLKPIVLPVEQTSEITFPDEVIVDPFIQSIINQVEQDIVSQYDRELAGELPVWVDAAYYTISSRYTYSGTPIQKATSYVGQRMAAQGLDVEYHIWEGSTYPNVIGEITGQTNPEDIFIIGAHLDDVQGTPGADDNASGSVATMLAAELLSQYDFNCTVRFAFWTGEEQGLLGSEAYAQRSADEGENILGYLNLDMIAWNTLDSPPDIDLIYNSKIRPTRDLAELMRDTIVAYNLDLIPQLVNDSSGGSDHKSFWDQGYVALLAIEDQSDFNPYYHTANDTPANTNLPYFTASVQASLATFLHMSNCVIPSGMGTLEGTVTDDTNGSPIPNATITMEDESGNIYTTQTDDTGYYAQRLMSGSYTVTAAANGYLPAIIPGVVILTNQVTSLDFSLLPGQAYTISGTVTEAGTGLPLYAHITFAESPIDDWTDPATGAYQVQLPNGEYTMYVTSDYHISELREIILDADQVQDFALELMRCVLLVDDDQNDPDTRSYYSTALDAIGADYDVWDIAAAGSPGLSNITGYKQVLWYLGRPYGGTFTSYNEAVIADYLDAGGNFFLSGQDYLYEMGLTSFGQNYLHIGSYSEDEILNFVTGENVYTGLGPYPLTYPLFENYSDVVHPDGQSLLAFNGDIDEAAISYDGEIFNTAFLGFSFEAIELMEYRASILSRTLDFFGGCARPRMIVDPLFIDVQVGVGESTSTSITLRNTTSTPISFSVSDLQSVSWMEYSPQSGILPPYATLPVDVAFDATLLVPGVYTTTLEAFTNDQPKVVVDLPVTLTVQPTCEAISSADFIWAPIRPSTGEMITFSAQTLGGTPSLYYWNFGDGHTGQGNPITHTYTIGSGYSVLLTASNACSALSVNHLLVITPVINKLPLVLK